MFSSLPSPTLSATLLQFNVQVVTPLAVDGASGSALRGSFFNAIWRRFCTNKTAPSCATCPLHDLCPVSALVAPLREDNERGQDIPRPYVMLPPMQGARCYQPGECFAFHITLIGNIVQLLPYLLLSIPEMEAEGFGHRLEENRGRRGRFQVEQVVSVHPFTTETQVIYEAGKTRVQAPVISLRADEWSQYAGQLNASQVTLRFVTPLRLIDREHLVKHLTFRPLIQRLLERYIALEHAYGDATLTLSREEKEALLQQAEQITRIADHTTWIELTSHSNRQHRTTPISGLLGEVTFTGQFAPFLELLLVGEVLHVGKNVVKGSGKYHIVRQRSPALAS